MNEQRSRQNWPIKDGYLETGNGTSIHDYEQPHLTGPAKPLPASADWYFILGDMTALPAISVNLAALDADAVGFAVIEFSPRTIASLSSRRGDKLDRQ